MNLSYNEDNWKALLEILHYTEQKNPNGNCYDIYDENGIPRWQIGQDEKELCYYFFMGQRYMMNHMKK